MERSTLQTLYNSWQGIESSVFHSYLWFSINQSTWQHTIPSLHSELYLLPHVTDERHHCRRLLMPLSTPPPGASSCSSWASSFTPLAALGHLSLFIFLRFYCQPTQLAVEWANRSETNTDKAEKGSISDRDLRLSQWLLTAAFPPFPFPIFQLQTAAFSAGQLKINLHLREWKDFNAYDSRTRALNFQVSSLQEKSLLVLKIPTHITLLSFNSICKLQTFVIATWKCHCLAANYLTHLLHVEQSHICHCHLSPPLIVCH